MGNLTPQRLAALYSDGSITLRDLISKIDDTNVATIYRELSEQDYQYIRTEIDSAPHGDDWDALRIAIAGSWVNTSREQYDEIMLQHKTRYRTGVEAIRDFLNHNDFT